MLCSVSSTDCEIFRTFVMFIYNPDTNTDMYAGSVQCERAVLFYSTYLISVLALLWQKHTSEGGDGVSLKCLC